jgi:multiple sugar transport system permease protein
MSRAGARPGPRIRRGTWRLAARYAGAVVLTIVFLFPVYWLFMISFKTPEEIFASPPVWYPANIQFDNFAVLFRDGDAVTVWNSLFVASVSTVLAMFLGTLCAYSLARFKTGGDNLAIWIISQRMIPPIAIVFPLFRVRDSSRSRRPLPPRSARGSMGACSFPWTATRPPR